MDQINGKNNKEHNHLWVRESKIICTQHRVIHTDLHCVEIGRYVISCFIFTVLLMAHANTLASNKLNLQGSSDT